MEEQTETQQIEKPAEPKPAEEKPKSKPKPGNPVKARAVKQLTEKIKNAKTLMIVSIKSLPSKQFQDIKKSVREHALIQVAKKNIMLRAIKEVEKDSIMPLEEHIKENCAFAISDIEGFELAEILSRKKNPVFAKAGQESPIEIEVKAGPTDLVPGPAISELGALGIQIAVEDGKISIKTPKVIVREGQEINADVASILQKLNIQPFTVGLEPVAIYDIQTEKIYTNIKIDPEETAIALKDAAAKALGFAQKIVYFCKDTIGYLLAKANSEGDCLGKLEPKETEKASEKSAEQKSEDKSEKPEEVSEEPKEEEKKEEEKKDEEKPAEEEKKEDNAQLNQAEETA